MADKGITVYPNVHSTDEDIACTVFRELVADSDALFLENAASDDAEEQERIFNLVSQNGTAVDNDSAWKESIEALISVLRGCKKRVYMERSPFTQAEIDCVNDDMTASMSEYLQGEPEKSFDTMRDYLNGYSNINRIRDSTMVRQLTRLQKDNPEQGILVVIGLKHAESLASGLRGNGCRAERIEKKNAPQCIINDLIDICYARGTPDTLGIARVVPETLMMFYKTKALLEPFMQSLPAARRAAEKLDYGSSCELSRELGRRKGLNEEDKMYLVCEKLGAF